MSEYDKISVNISGQNEGVEIRLLDAGFNLLEEGVGMLRTDLPPGLYTVEYQFGSMLKEEVIRLTPKKNYLSINVPQFEVKSPLPVSQSKEGRQRSQIDAAIQFRDELLGHSGTSGLLIFISGEQAEPLVNENTFSLLPVGWEEDVRLKMGGPIPSPDGGFYIGFGSSLDSGDYRLRIDLDKNRVETIVHLAEGWETQLFLNQKESGQPGLANMAAIMLRYGEHLDPYSHRLDLTDTALKALLYEKKVSGQENMDLLNSKFFSPMLGIYWMLLHLRKSKINTGLVNTVLGNLGDLIPRHPDVKLLTLWRDLNLNLDEFAAYQTNFASPPMLRQSWQILLEQAESHSNLIPMGSLASTIGDRLWGSTPWLFWTYDEKMDDNLQHAFEATERGVLFERSVSDEEGLAAFLKSLYEKAAGDELPGTSKLSREEKALLDYLLNYPVNGVLKGMGGRMKKFKDDKLMRMLTGHLMDDEAAFPLLKKLVLKTVAEKIKPALPQFADAIETALGNIGLPSLGIQLPLSKLKEVSAKLGNEIAELVKDVKVEELDFKSIGKQMHMPENTVKQILLRLDEKL